MQLKPWNRLRHYNAMPCFQRIADARKATGMEDPGSSGKPRQITLTHPHKLTAYVGLRTRARDHSPGTPWYCQWDKQRSGKKTIPRREFADRNALMQYLKREEYI